VKTVTHEEVDSEFLGGATTHTTKSASHTSRRRTRRRRSTQRDGCSSYLPQNNLGDAPGPRGRSADRMDDALDTIVPDDPRRPTTCMT
jgi:acetyl-CoA carboxylase carboxyltransferase component